MAERYRTAAGNWSNAAQWDGGATLPGVADDCYANNFAVTIDQDVTVLSLRTMAGATAVAGGSFTNTSFTVNADVRAGTTTCYSCSTTGVLNGDSFGGTAANARGANITGFSVQNGDSTGGSNGSAAGTFAQNGAVQNGDSYAGSAAPGTNTSGGGTHNGDSHAGAAAVVGSLLQNGGIQNGDSYGGSVANAVGTSIASGAIHHGRCFGGTNATAYGTSVTAGGVMVVEQITDATAPGLRIASDTTVILFGPTTAAQISNGAVSGRFAISRGTSTRRPFVRPPFHPASVA